jgi:hypothetical protein
MSVRAAIFDIDGVLADSFWRGHYIWKNKPDWEGFFDACPNDPPQALAALPAILEDAGYTLFYVTCRPEWNREKTEAWLIEHLGDVKRPHPIMRPDDIGKTNWGDGDSWKVNVIRDLAGKHDVHFIFEDCPTIIIRLRALKLPVVPILSGYYPWRVPK